MKERQKSGPLLALLAAVFAVLFIVQATKTQARSSRRQCRAMQRRPLILSVRVAMGKMGVRNRCTQNMCMLAI